MAIALILFGRTASGDADWPGSNIPVTAHLSRSLVHRYAQYSNIMKFYRDSGRRTLRLRQRLLELERIVDDDDIGTLPGQHPADRGGDTAALRGGLELGHRLMPRREAGPEQPLVPFAGDDAAAVARQFLGEVLAPGLRSRPTVAVKPGVTQRILNARVMRETRPERRPRPSATSDGAAARRSAGGSGPRAPPPPRAAGP